MNRKFGRKDNSLRISSLRSCFITFVKWAENTGTFKNKWADPKDVPTKVMPSQMMQWPCYISSTIAKSENKTIRCTWYPNDNAAYASISNQLKYQVRQYLKSNNVTEKRRSLPSMDVSMAPVQDAIICWTGVMSLPMTGLEIVSDDSPIVSSVYITIKTKYKTEKFVKTKRNVQVFPPTLLTHCVCLITVSWAGSRTTVSTLQQ